MSKRGFVRGLRRTPPSVPPARVAVAAPLALPELVIKRKPDSLFDYRFDDFEIVGYESHPHIKAPVAV